VPANPQSAIRNPKSGDPAPKTPAFDRAIIARLSVMGKLATTLAMIRIEHSVFALPFAFLGAFLAAQGLPTAHQILWIVVAMVSARSAAMGFNRLVDRHYDARNPRTSSRALPRGEVSSRFVWSFVVVSALVFAAAAWMLNPLAFYLTPLALVLVFFYSYTKRFTSLSHLFLGLALGIAPVGAWIAVRGQLEATPLFLTAAVLFWVAGFDIIYACQDIDFDRRTRLYSLPARFGVRTALRVSAGLHLIMFLILGYLFLALDLGTLSWVGLGIVALALLFEHSLVTSEDLSRVNSAFFTINGFVSIVLFLFVGLDLCLFV
jgi:4-hydroxybenzoate polyprenyltransferase